MYDKGDKQRYGFCDLFAKKMEIKKNIKETKSLNFYHGEIIKMLMLS